MGIHGKETIPAYNWIRQKYFQENHGLAKGEPLDLSQKVWFNRRGIAIDQLPPMIEKWEGLKYVREDVHDIMAQVNFANEMIYPDAMPLTHALAIFGGNDEDIANYEPNLYDHPFMEHHSSIAFPWFRCTLVYIEEVKEIYNAGEITYQGGSWQG